MRRVSAPKTLLPNSTSACASDCCPSVLTARSRLSLFAVQPGESRLAFLSGKTIAAGWTGRSTIALEARQTVLTGRTRDSIRSFWSLSNAYVMADIAVPANGGRVHINSLSSMKIEAHRITKKKKKNRKEEIVIDYRDNVKYFTKLSSLCQKSILIRYGSYKLMMSDATGFHKR